MIANHPQEPYDSPIYYPFWQAASELGVPISLHIITSTKKQNLGSFSNSVTITLQIEYVFETQCSLARMLMGGVLERFPKLKLISTENDIGWMPYFLYRLDHNYDLGVGRDLPPLKPSDYARRQIVGDVPGRSLRRGAVQVVWRGQLHVGVGLSASGFDLAPLARR